MMTCLEIVMRVIKMVRIYAPKSAISPITGRRIPFSYYPPFMGIPELPVHLVARQIEGLYHIINHPHVKRVINQNRYLDRIARETRFGSTPKETRRRQFGKYSSRKRKYSNRYFGSRRFQSKLHY